MLSGRGFNAADLHSEQTAVLVNRTFAECALGARSPVGRRLRYVSYAGKLGPWHEIVGVVPDLATNLTEPQNGLGIYHAAAAGEIYPIHLAIHLGSDPTAFVPRLREMAAPAAPAATVAQAQALDRFVPDSWYGMNGFRIGWSVFIGILLVLAASGVYTMMAFSVSQRTSEIGIRSALGARPAQIVRVIGGRAAFQVGMGALIGMPLAGWAYFGIQQYTTSASSVFLVAVLPGVIAMTIVGLLTCTAPLPRTLRISPREAMRVDG